MIEFITHGSFILRIKQIKYIKLLDDEADVEVVIEENGQDRSFTMKYESNYEAQAALEMLSLDLDAHYMGNAWRHPLVKSVQDVGENILDMQKEMENIQKEFNLLRKKLKHKER